MKSVKRLTCTLFCCHADARPPSISLAALPFSSFEGGLFVQRILRHKARSVAYRYCQAVTCTLG